MSNPTTTVSQEAAQQAHATLVNEMLVPLYFAKLAEYGRQPATEDEAQVYVQLLGQALQARDQGLLQPQPSPQESLAKRASQRLAQHLGQFQPPANPEADDATWAKNAAAHFVQNPTVQQAIVTYQTALLGA